MPLSRNATNKKDPRHCLSQTEGFFLHCRLYSANLPPLRKCLVAIFRRFLVKRIGRERRIPEVYDVFPYTAHVKSFRLMRTTFLGAA
jgi:hypothetical protein